MFPANIKTALTTLRSSNDFIYDRTVLVVQGMKAPHCDDVLQQGNRPVDAPGAFDAVSGQTTAGPDRLLRFPRRSGLEIPFEWTMVGWTAG